MDVKESSTLLHFPKKVKDRVEDSPLPSATELPGAQDPPHAPTQEQQQASVLPLPLSPSPKRRRKKKKRTRKSKKKRRKKTCAFSSSYPSSDELWSEIARAYDRAIVRASDPCSWNEHARA